MRVCTKCDIPKLLAEFPSDPRYRNGLKRECVTCASNRAAENYQRNKARHQSNSRRGHLQRKFGITPEQFDAMLEAQGGVCGVCDSTDPSGRGAFAVDHDHSCCPGKESCGKCIRKLLCFGCNTGLGNFDDDVDRLQAAIDYLKSHEQITSLLASKL